MFLDEVSAWFNFVAHEHSEHFIGGGGVRQGNLDQRTIHFVECRFTQFLGVHFTKTLESCNLQAFFSRFSHSGQESSQIFDAFLSIFAMQVKLRFRSTCSFLRKQILDRERVLL